MKTQSSRRQGGFTLVELLVVIAIIAVLAGAGFAAGNAAVQKARKVTALAAATSLEAAVNSYFNEYSSMPKEDMTTDTEIDTKIDKDFLKVLLGMETGTNALNTKSIKFLQAKEGKNGKGGLIYSGSGKAQTIESYIDPWGGSYKVMLDGDYDEIVEVKTKGETKKTSLNGRRVAVWSDGADGVSTTGKANDDVKTW